MKRVIDSIKGPNSYLDPIATDHLSVGKQQQKLRRQKSEMRKKAQRAGRRISKQQLHNDISGDVDG